MKIRPCHVCGREFGASAMAIHLMQCGKFQVAQERCHPDQDPVCQSQQVLPMNDEASLHSGKFLSISSGYVSPSSRYNSPSSSAHASPRGSRFVVLSSASEEVRARTANSLASTNENRTENCSRTATRTVICETCQREFTVATYRIHRLRCSPQLVEAAVKVIDADAAPGFNKRPKSSSPDNPRLRSNTDTFRAENCDAVMPAVLSEKAAPKAKVVLCYICGREFGIGSVDVHMPQCRKQWETKEALKPPDKRRTLPTPPEALPSVSPEEYNKLAQENLFDEMLVACGHCGKSFPNESLLTHQRSCAGKSGKVLCASTSSLPAPEVVKSISLFATSSQVSRNKVRRSGDEGETGRLRQAAQDKTAIHSAECAARHEAQGAMIIPERPPALSNASSAVRNMSASPRCYSGCGTWSTSPALNRSRVPCQICGREFGPSSIQIHETQCAKKFGGQTVPDRRERCEHCGNMFLPDRLEAHLLTCSQWKDLGN